MIEISNVRRQWIDNFGNDIESTPTYQQRDDLSSHRINLNIMPAEHENVLVYINRMRRSARQNSEVQECHFNGMQKVFFCHKNPATCWVCDINTVQLYSSKMNVRLADIPEIKEVYEKVFWEQQSNGKFDWVYTP